MNGFKYILRILKGESPIKVLSSMPQEDFAKVQEVIKNIDNSTLSRQRRRKMKRELSKVKR